MTSLITRRIDSDVAQETWHIQSARSPHASATPAPLRNGNGAAGSIRAGTAAAFDQARAGLRSRIAHVRCEGHRGLTFKLGATNAIGPRRSIVALIGASGCRPIDRVSTPTPFNSIDPRPFVAQAHI